MTGADNSSSLPGTARKEPGRAGLHGQQARQKARRAPSSRVLALAPPTKAEQTAAWQLLLRTSPEPELLLTVLDWVCALPGLSLDDLTGFLAFPTRRLVEGWIEQLLAHRFLQRCRLDLPAPALVDLLSLGGECPAGQGKHPPARSYLADEPGRRDLIYLPTPQAFGFLADLTHKTPGEVQRAYGYGRAQVAQVILEYARLREIRRFFCHLLDACEFGLPGTPRLGDWHLGGSVTVPCARLTARRHRFLSPIRSSTTPSGTRMKRATLRFDGGGLLRRPLLPPERAATPGCLQGTPAKPLLSWPFALFWDGDRPQLPMSAVAETVWLLTLLQRSRSDGTIRGQDPCSGEEEGFLPYPLVVVGSEARLEAWLVSARAAAQHARFSMLPLHLTTRAELEGAYRECQRRPGALATLPLWRTPGQRERSALAEPCPSRSGAPLPMRIHTSLAARPPTAPPQTQEEDSGQQSAHAAPVALSAPSSLPRQPRRVTLSGYYCARVLAGNELQARGALSANEVTRTLRALFAAQIAAANAPLRAYAAHRDADLLKRRTCPACSPGRCRAAHSPDAFLAPPYRRARDAARDGKRAAFQTTPRPAPFSRSARHSASRQRCACGTDRPHLPLSSRPSADLLAGLTLFLSATEKLVLQHLARYPLLSRPQVEYTLSLRCLADLFAALTELDLIEAVPLDTGQVHPALREAVDAIAPFASSHPALLPEPLRPAYWRRAAPDEPDVKGAGQERAPLYILSPLAYALLSAWQERGQTRTVSPSWRVPPELRNAWIHTVEAQSFRLLLLKEAARERQVWRQRQRAYRLPVGSSSQRVRAPSAIPDHLAAFTPPTEARVAYLAQGRTRYLYPDAAGEYVHQGERYPFFLEWDRGIGGGGVGLAQKFAAYARFYLRDERLALFFQRAFGEVAGNERAKAEEPESGAQASSGPDAAIGAHLTTQRLFASLQAGASSPALPGSICSLHPSLLVVSSTLSRERYIRRIARTAYADSVRLSGLASRLCQPAGQGEHFPVLFTTVPLVSSVGIAGEIWRDAWHEPRRSWFTPGTGS